MKRFFVAALALLISVGAFAEGFGVIGGVTSSQMKFKDIDLKSYTGAHVGVAYNLPLGAGFALQPELIYNVKGTNWEELKTKAKYGYVELPVQLQWGLDLVMLRPYVFAEPFAGYAVTGSKVINSDKAKINLSNVKSRFEYGLGIGAGVEVYNRVQLAFKYYWNFENADQWSVVADMVKAKSFSGLVFTAGIFF